MTIPNNVTRIMQGLLDNGFEAYIIGGAIRDIKMNVKPNDYDIFTDATGDEILSIFPDGKIIGGEKRQEKILTVIVDGVEVSQYRANGNRTETGNDLSTHLATCDFRMNAMAMDIDGITKDYHFGDIDIDNRIINTVGNPYHRITEDKLRTFRAVRFSVKYNFRIGKPLDRAIFETDVSDLPIERIREEILKILMYPGGLAALEDSGLLEQVIPEFSDNCKLEGGNHHAEFVNHHMSHSQNIACGLTDNKALVFACAFHDIGKGICHKFRSRYDVSFHGHEKVGAEMINTVMNYLKFSVKDIKYVETLIYNHLVNYDSQTTDKAYIRLFKRLEIGGVSIEDYMIMLYADNQGNQRNKRVKFGDFINNNKILAKYYKLKYSKIPFDISGLDINGHDLINIGIPAGPLMGKVLDDLFELVISGEIENRFGVLIRHVEDITK